MKTGLKANFDPLSAIRKQKASNFILLNLKEMRYTIMTQFEESNPVFSIIVIFQVILPEYFQLYIVCT